MAENLKGAKVLQETRNLNSDGIEDVCLKADDTKKGKKRLKQYICT